MFAMYAIIYWGENDESIHFVANEDNSVMIFDKLSEADAFADTLPNSDDVRVVSLEAVNE